MAEFLIQVRKTKLGRTDSGRDINRNPRTRYTAPESAQSFRRVRYAEQNSAELAEWCAK